MLPIFQMCNTQLKESAALLLNLHFLLKRQLPVTICLILRLDTFSICFDIYNEIFSLTEKAKDFGILEELFGQNTSSLESIFISVKHPFKAIRKKKNLLLWKILICHIMHRLQSAVYT